MSAVLKECERLESFAETHRACVDGASEIAGEYHDGAADALADAAGRIREAAAKDAAELARLRRRFAAVVDAASTLGALALHADRAAEDGSLPVVDQASHRWQAEAFWRASIIIGDALTGDLDALEADQ